MQFLPHRALRSPHARPPVRALFRRSAPSEGLRSAASLPSGAPSRSTTRRLAARVTLLALALGLAAAGLQPAAQGAQEILLGPPRGSFGPGPGDAVRGGPGDRTDPANQARGVDRIFIDDASWQRWWTFNREPYLLRLRAPAAVPVEPAPLGSAGPLPGNPSRPSIDVVYGDVAPALLELLEKHGRDNDVRGATLMALAKLGPPPSGEGHDEVGEAIVEALREGLGDRNESVREAAIVALGIHGDAREAEALAELVREGDDAREVLRGASLDRRTRAFAAFALADVGFASRRAVERAFVVRHLTDALRAELEDSNIATACVVGLGLNPLPYPDKAPRSAEVPGRTRMIETLLAADDSGELDPLARGQVPVALARLVLAPDVTVPDSPAVAKLREEQRRQLVARFTAPITSRGSRDRGPVQLREGAAQALGLIVVSPDPDAKEDDVDRLALAALKRLAEAGQEREAGLAMVSLARIAARIHDAAPELAVGTVEGLVELMSVGDPSARPWAALALGVLAGDLPADHPLLGPDVGVEAALLKRFDEAPTPDEQSAVGMALGLLGRDNGAAQELRPLLGEGDFHIRGLYATSLALMDARSAIEPMREIAASGVYRPYLLRDIATALMLFRDPYVADLLVAKLGVAKFMPERLAALQALAWTSDQRAIGPILEIMQKGRYRGRNIDQTTRAFAAAALGALCAQEAAPWNAKFALDVTWNGAPPCLTDRRDGGGVLDLF